MLDEQKEKGLIEILRLEDLPPETQKSVITMAVDVVEARALSRVLDRLDDKDRETFRNFMENENDENLGNFLEERNIDIAEIIREETLRFKEEITEELQDK